MTVQTVYDHIADFIAGLNPEKVLELKAAYLPEIHSTDSTLTTS